MKEAEKEAERIIEMFKQQIAALPLTLNPSKKEVKEYHFIIKQCAILHVEGIIEALENNQWQNRKLIEHQQQVKQAIENK